MEENKKEVEQNEEKNLHRKAFWMVGIALIVFLILVLGSIIGLKIVRDRADDITNNGNAIINNGTQVSEDLNYNVLENGRKENVSEGVTDASFDFDGIRVSQFEIEQRDDRTTFKASIENFTEELKDDVILAVTLFDSQDNLITEFTVQARKLKAQRHSMVVVDLEPMESINAERIDVRMISEDVVSKEAEQ